MGRKREMHLCHYLSIYNPFFGRALLWHQSPNTDGARCCCSGVRNIITGPSRINCISCNFCIASSSYAGLTIYPYFFLWLRLKGAWLGACTDSEGKAGEGAQGVSSFRETHLGGRFHPELWGLAANLTACWSSWEHCSPMPCPGAFLPVIQACSDPTHETWDNAVASSDRPLRLGLISGESGAAARRQQFPIAFWQWNYSAFCALLLMKRQLFATLFIFSDVFVWETFCI